MNEMLIFNGVMFLLLVTAGGVFDLLFFVTAPYGRHIRKGWGPSLDNKIAWIIMELFPPVGFAMLFFLGSWKTGYLPYIFLFLWLFHYLYRALMFPMLIRGNKTMPVSVMLFGIIFNSLNAYTQGRYLYFLSPGLEKYGPTWLTTPQFVIGVILFFTGFAIHSTSDSITRNLRQPGESGYKIPFGGLFTWVSCPNYLGEILQWFGWAVLTWSIPGLVFALWTVANLMPRARANHEWYNDTFEDYPRKRKALIPFLF